VQRHVLRDREASGDPRERALQSVVRLAAEVRDPVREGVLLERAAAVFGFSAAVLARAVSLQRGGQRSTAPLEAAVRRERKTESVAERHLLRALLRAPQALADVREQLTPEAFQDPTARALAEWLWRDESGLPDDGEPAQLARELLTEGPDQLDWSAEAQGAARKLVERQLRQRLRERRQELERSDEENRTRLMHEIDQIARSLQELSA
jgi:hypothetical protein